MSIATRLIREQQKRIVELQDTIEFQSEEIKELKMATDPYYEQSIRNLRNMIGELKLKLSL